MQRSLLLFVLLLLISTAAGAQNKANSNSASAAKKMILSGQEVLKLNKEYTDAIARRDASVHERLFASDYTYTPGNGSLMGRDDHMNFTRSGTTVVQSLRNEEVRARLYGETAVVTGLWISVDKRGVKEFVERRIRYILVFVRRNGRWQIVAEQRTGAERGTAVLVNTNLTVHHSAGK